MDDIALPERMSDLSTEEADDLIVRLGRRHRWLLRRVLLQVVVAVGSLAAPTYIWGPCPQVVVVACFALHATFLVPIVKLTYLNFRLRRLVRKYIDLDSE